MKNNRFLFVLIILLIGLVNFYKVYEFDFSLDDNLYITKNEVVKEGISSIPTLFSKQSGFGNAEYENFIKAYRPLTLTSFALDKTLFNLSNKWMHIENLVLYLVLCVLVYFLLNKIWFQDEYKYFNLLVAIIFTVLPIHQEVICCIKSRDEIFSLLFLVSSLLLLISFVNTERKIYLFLTNLFFLCSLMSKETALTYLFVFPIFLYLVLNLSLKKSVYISLTFIAPLLIFLSLRWLAVHEVMDLPLILENNALLEINNFFERKLNVLYFIGIYFFKIVIPTPLLWDYSVGYWKFNQATAIFGFVVLIGFITTFYYFYKKNLKILLFGLLFFFITINITSNLFIEIPATFADRFNFTPSLALVFLVAPLNSIKFNYLMGFSLVLVSLYSYINFTTIKSWKNEMTMFEYNSSAIKSQRGYVTYALAILNTNDTAKYDKIPFLINKSRKIIPISFMNENVMGMYNLRVKKVNEALENFLICKSLNPKSKAIDEKISQINSTKVFSSTRLDEIKKSIDAQDYEKALDLINETLILNDKSSDLYYYKGFVLTKQNKFKDAIENYYTSIDLDKSNPRNLPIYFAITEIETKTNNLQGVIKPLQEIIKVEPNNFLAIKNLSIAYFKLNVINECNKYIKLGLKINPNDKELNFLNNKLNP